MAITAAQAKLQLSFNMVDKTMTAYVQQVVMDQVLATDGVIEYNGYYITDPLGDTYSIDEISASVSGQTFDAATDSEGNVIEGNYTITGGYIYIYLTSLDETYTFAYNDSDFTLSYTTKSATISQLFDCIAPTFTSVDTTDYRVLDPTGPFITPTTVVYAHNLYYPVTSNGYGSPTETSDLSITRGYQEFYQGTQTGTVSHQLYYTFVDGLIVYDTIEGDLETRVDCADEMCSLACRVNNLEAQTAAQKDVNTGEYIRLNNILIQAAMFTSLAQLNLNCGNSDMVQYYKAKVVALTSNCCTGCDDCSPADGTPISGSGN